MGVSSRLDLDQRTATQRKIALVSFAPFLFFPWKREECKLTNAKGKADPGGVLGEGFPGSPNESFPLEEVSSGREDGPG